MRRDSGWWVVIFITLGFLTGFSVAMALVGDSPWSGYWIDMARCCDGG